MQISSWADVQALSGDAALTPAEEQLIAACARGTPCWLDEGDCPNTDSPECRIRAPLLRYLIVGGCAGFAVDPVGVQVRGAWISGALSLDFVTANGQTSLVNCRFEKPIDALQARLTLLNLSGSTLPGLMLQGARIEGSCYLRHGFHCQGPVSMAGIRIGGQLDAKEGRFDNPAGNALNAQDARIEGAVYLRYGFVAQGKVSLSGAQIGGRLSCREGQFDCEEGAALNASGMQVAERLTWVDVGLGAGSVDFSSTRIGDLMDDLASWPQGPDRLDLDGFTYTRISGAFTDARQRLDWLSRGTVLNGEFAPQPYAHLANVLRTMGHDAEARAVLVEQRRLIGVHERRRLLMEAETPAKRLLARVWTAGLWLWEEVQHWTVGYGYKPFRCLVVLAVLFVIATALSHRAWQAGDFAPNSGVILMSPGWTALASDPDVTNPARLWSGDGLTEAETQQAPGRDWETFNRYAYAFDVVVPILPLGQTDAWAPSTSRGPWGRVLWWMRWALSGLGWIVTALGAAAVAGIIRRE